MHQNKFKEAWEIYRSPKKVTVYRFSFPFQEMKEENIFKKSYIFTVDFLFTRFSCCNYSLNMFHKLTVSDTGFGNILWLVYLKPFKVTFFSSPFSVYF